MREPQVDGAAIDEQVFVVVRDFAEAENYSSFFESSNLNAISNGELQFRKASD
jgi:hypothetical protein